MTWRVPLVLALAAPLLTWLPMLAIRHPALGLPGYEPSTGIDLWQMQMLGVGVLALIASLVWAQDRPLALALILVGLTLAWRGAYSEVTHVAQGNGQTLQWPGTVFEGTHVMGFGIGALLLWALRGTPASALPFAGRLLGGLGAFQALYICAQWYLQKDLLWVTAWGAQPLPVLQPLGTLGGVDIATTYVAITAPLMPVWMLPFAVGAVYSGVSLTANAALALGLFVRYVLMGGSSSVLRRYRWTISALAGIPALALVYEKIIALSPSVVGRLAIWKFGLYQAAVSDPVVGWGLGGWAARIPPLQFQYGVMPNRQVWREAHSEPIQWVCETGLVGAALLVWWLIEHRAMFAHPQWGPSLCAAAIGCLGVFPLHVVSTALAILIPVGLATRPEPALGGA